MIPAALLSFALATAALPPRPATAVVPSSGRVVSPEGFRVQLPVGSAFAPSREEGRTTWFAVSKDRPSAVAVAASISEEPLGCDRPDPERFDWGDEEDEGEADEGSAPDDGGVELGPFETEDGGEACLPLDGAPWFRVR
jgi:hypothetical protein